VMALLLVLGPLLLPEFRDRGAGRPDLASAGLSLAAVLAVIWGLKQLAQDGLGWPPALAILAGLTVGVGFMRRQQRVADPLLDLRLFGNRAFSAALATNALSFFVGFGALLFIAQYLQLVLGLSPLAAGLWMLPSSAGFIVGSLLAPLLVRRAPPAVVMAAGLVVAAAGFGLLTQLGGASGLAVLVAGSVVFSLGLGPVDTVAADLTVGAAPPQRAGAASALSETSSELGGALGIATLGSIGTAIYRYQVTDTLPAGVPPHAAGDTLGGAVAAASQLPDRLGGALLDTAREAFTQGLHLSFAVSAALMVGIAVLVAVLLRGEHASSQPQGQSGPRQDGPCAGKVGAVKAPGQVAEAQGKVMTTCATPMAAALPPPAGRWCWLGWPPAMPSACSALPGLPTPPRRCLPSGSRCCPVTFRAS
jgi:MFS transporter, DHA2 family, multidrug resistance protein